MIEALVFPDTRACLFDLIDEAEHLGNPVRAVYRLPTDSRGALEEPFPIALIYTMGGTEGYVDRVDRVTIEVYAPGEQAVNTLESIRASIVGDSIETPSGYLDEIAVESVPTEVPYISDKLNKAEARFLVTSRPIT
ncbi:hypothetical protein [Zhihengliuella flava]|uniref:Uncharacterized protein n=1 Tax=Zhihengliuella flava TaxID=1285193 RepID=A0A931GK70_9MICC|nr:hypothetical protein [Zhihengliuella flava]MBG6083239.1 hypothetical protein [Zhihengliuella flava]